MIENKDKKGIFTFIPIFKKQKFIPLLYENPKNRDTINGFYIFILKFKFYFFKIVVNEK